VVVTTNPNGWRVPQVLARQSRRSRMCPGVTPAERLVKSRTLLGGWRQPGGSVVTASEEGLQVLHENGP